MLVVAINSVLKRYVPLNTVLPVLSNLGVSSCFQIHTDSFCLSSQENLILFRRTAQPQNWPAATFVATPGNPGPPVEAHNSSRSGGLAGTLWLKK